MKELIDKDVVMIDQEEYVKVLNPKASDGKDQPRYLYVPVNEYLSRKETFTATTTQMEGVKKEASVALVKPSPSSLLEEETLAVSPSKSVLPRLKKKVLIAYFDDRTTQGEEVFGDWVAEKLMVY